MARTGSPSARSRRTTRLPTCPVAPTTRTIRPPASSARPSSTAGYRVHRFARALFQPDPPRDGRGVSTTSDLGVHGERVAVSYLTDHGFPGAGPELALPGGRARHRRPRRRHAGVLRGEDAARGRLRPSRRGGDPGQAAPSAHTGAPVAGRPRRARPRAALRRRGCARASLPAGPGHAPPGGLPVTLARTWSVGLAGVHGAMVEVEVDMAAGVPHVALVGLPDAVVRQSVDRVRAAVVNAGASFPQRRITIGLSPASMPKQGSGFDLALAAAVLAASGAVPQESVDRLVLLGELGLDGSVRGIRGVLPAVLAAARAGHSQVVVPAANAEEAALVDSVEVLAAHTLAEVVAHLAGRERLTRYVRGPLPDPAPPPDLGDVVGQAAGRRAVEVAAAGGHHLFLAGPPGAGKTMLAERLPGLLPPLDEQAALEVTAIHSVAGTLPPGAPLVTRPTFEAPHYSATMAALIGGGSGQIRPGALCRAHRGVLFLDE